MTLWLYYRKTIDKMVLLNDDPSEEWKEKGRDHTCELYVNGQVEIIQGSATLVSSGPEQRLVRYALRLEAYE